MISSKLDSKALSLLKNKIRIIEKENDYIYLAGPVHLPVDLYGSIVIFQWYCWLQGKNSVNSYEEIINLLSSSNLADFQQSTVLTYGDFKESDESLIRIHSICHTGDIFSSKRCDCGYQLKQSMKMIVEHGSGALLYLANQEGRGIGLFPKALAYLLQENGYDTVEANNALGFSDDIRDYSDAISVLKELRQKPVTLITNNPQKIKAIKNAGVVVTEQTSLWGNISKYNEYYLNTKVKKSGHLLDSEGDEHALKNLKI